MKVTRKILFEIGILLFSLFYLFNSIKLEVGELSRPGPGFFPIVLGASGVVIAALLVASSILKQKREGKEEEVPSPEQKKEIRQSLTRMFSYIMALTALIALYDFLGSLVAFFLVSVTFGKITGMRGWGRPLFLGLCTSIAIYVIFGLWFKLPLPGGILEKLF